MGKSTETALHSVVGYIEKAIEANEIVIAAFVDIEGAFDRTTRTTIDNTLLNKGPPLTIRRWITRMLSDGDIRSEWKGKTEQGKVNEGCPQGGIILPLIWHIVVDELLSILDREGIFSVTYADDFAILVKGKYEEVLPDLLQIALTMVGEGC